MKKTYESPQLIELGTITEITQGWGARGNSDSFCFFGWSPIVASG